MKSILHFMPIAHFARVAGGLARRVFQPAIAGVLLAMALFFIPSTLLAKEAKQLDWSTWRHLPAFQEGRVAPLNTVARETIEAICGRTEPTLFVNGERWRKFDADELLFSWLAEPETWEDVPFLVAEDRALRRVLGLPLVDTRGRRLRYASPVEVENNVELGRRWAELEQQERALGKKFCPTSLDKHIANLVNAYGRYRRLTFDPKSPKDVPRRFYARAAAAKKVWSRLADYVLASRQTNSDKEIPRRMIAAADAWRTIIAEMHQHDVSIETIEPSVTAFHRATQRLAAVLTKTSDKPLAALGTRLAQEADELRLALYDNGGCLRLVPSLNTRALMEDREPDDDASPWLGFQAMLLGSDDLLHDYPQPELKAARKAFAKTRSVYLDRTASDRPRQFAAAMDRFVTSLRELGEKVSGARRVPTAAHGECGTQKLLTLTAYPPFGSTDAEVFYNRLDPFFWSWTISLAAAICLLLAVGTWQRPLFWLGVVVLVVAQAFTAVGLGLRGYITGLVPLTSMFETVISVALYAAILGLWLTLKPMVCRRRRLSPMDDPAPLPSATGVASYSDVTHDILRRRPFVLAGAIVSFIAAALAYYAPATVMHRHLGAAMPILRDNFWLAVHVLTIMASYASAAIALILGNIALGYYLFGRYRHRTPPARCSTLAGFIYTALQITVLLLAAGTALGALWADKAWGRFWGWDPKEVWALVSLLTYLLILHARHVGWSGNFGMAVAAVLGFTAILFTWYGVNFLLGSGRHSYGSGAGGTWAVLGALAVQWLFLGAAALRKTIELQEGNPQ